MAVTWNQGRTICFTGAVNWCHIQLNEGTAHPWYMMLPYSTHTKWFFCINGVDGDWQIFNAMEESVGVSSFIPTQKTKTSGPSCSERNGARSLSLVLSSWAVLDTPAILQLWLTSPLQAQEHMQTTISFSDKNLTCSGSRHHTIKEFSRFLQMC